MMMNLINILEVLKILETTEKDSASNQHLKMTLYGLYVPVLLMIKKPGWMLLFHSFTKKLMEFHLKQEHKFQMNSIWAVETQECLNMMEHKKLDLLMENGKLFKTGVSVHQLVEEEKPSYKESVLPQKTEVNHVKENQLKKNHATLNHVHYHLELKVKKNNQMTSLPLSKWTK